MPHYPWISVVARSAGDINLCRVVAFSVPASGSSGIGPYDVDMAIQLHGLSDSRLSYTLVPALGGLPSGVSPDATQVPVSGYPLILPAGSSLVINNTGAGTRAYSASIWPI